MGKRPDVLDRRAEDEKQESQRQEKVVAEYKEQLDPPFEHEQRLKELLVKRTQLNAALDLDKNEHQVAPDDLQTEKEPAASTFAARASGDRAAEMGL